MSQTMSRPQIAAFSALFTALIVASNYLVQIPLGSLLTLGALTYPFTFLLSDVISERYGKQCALKVVRIGILAAFVPSYFLADPQIAIASIVAFFLSQQADVLAFFALKKHFLRAWWLRSGGSTIFSQALDTLLFFGIAFWGVLPPAEAAMLGLGDYSVKVILAFANLPFFYIFGIFLAKEFALGSKKNRLF